MVVFAYGRWSFLGGSNCKALIGKSLVFLDNLVVAHERWSYLGSTVISKKKGDIAPLTELKRYNVGVIHRDLTES